MKICEKCGATNSNDLYYCKNCGNSLGEPIKEPTNNNLKSAIPVLIASIALIVGGIFLSQDGFSSTKNATASVNQQVNSGNVSNSESNNLNDKNNSSNSVNRDNTKSVNNSRNYSNNNSNNNSSSSYNSGYIIPDSNVRYLSRSELYGYTKEQLAYIRNEIFARHGYVFEKAKYRNYFSAKSWYTPDYSFNYEYDLNSIEKANVDLIKELEK